MKFVNEGWGNVRQVSAVCCVVCTCLFAVGCAPKEDAAAAGGAASAAPAAAPVSNAEAIAKIEANPNIPAPQKAMLVKQLQDQNKPKTASTK